MNNKIIYKLRHIAKKTDFHGYYKLEKTDLIALLLEQSILGNADTTVKN